MPVTPLTEACRAAAARMQAFSQVEGNLQVLRQMVYEDSAQLDALRQALMDAGAGVDLVTVVADAHVLVSNASECSGVISFHHKLIAAGAALDPALDFIEAQPEPEPEA